MENPKNSFGVFLERWGKPRPQTNMGIIARQAFQPCTPLCSQVKNLKTFPSNQLDKTHQNLHNVFPKHYVKI